MDVFEATRGSHLPVVRTPNERENSVSTVVTSAIERLRTETGRYDKPKYRKNYQRFFKEKLAQPESIALDYLRKISATVYRDFRKTPVNERLALCDALLKDGTDYSRFFAFDWAHKSIKECKAGEFRRFERWLKSYVNNWASCDHLCCGVIGELVSANPGLVPKTRRWAKSKNRWLRRASAVALIPGLRESIEVRDGFATADLLLGDEDDMVRKGCGWMLKEATKRFQREVFSYVMTNRDKMSRTTLRYAIEKLPTGMKTRAMGKSR
jgi:3-methyladenine DNA glycosylase AlkD